MAKHKLKKIINKPKRPLVLLLGGAKVSTKLDLINRYIHKADKIIIGGGIAGMSIAYGLCENQRILVLERESNLGYHSTGRSAAVYAASYKSSNSAINALKTHQVCKCVTIRGPTYS